jgi:hypothetical protein
MSNLLSYISVLCLIVSSLNSQETFDTLQAKSVKFGEEIVNFPTVNNLISSIAGDNAFKKQDIAKQANSVRPIVHQKVITLVQNFLKYKKEYGSEVEKSLYKEMDLKAFIDRLLTQRPMVFVGALDLSIIKEDAKMGVKGVRGGSVASPFEFIGKPKQTPPLVLENYLSYDEMQISALLGVSVPTYFINDGDRKNKAMPGEPGTFEECGISTGLVGARFERPGCMEWSHMIITPEQNTATNGYGLSNDQDNQGSLLKIWSDFYGTKLPTFVEARNAKDDNKYMPIVIHRKKVYLNIEVYKKRIKMVIVPFLVDTNNRGIEQRGKLAYCHVVGLGLGVWQLTSIQAKLMLEAYTEVLSQLNLPNISDINFSWFPSEYQKIDECEDGSTLTLGRNNIKIHFSKRNPAAKLNGTDKNKLLVAMYAWDGNAYPGNEYWIGRLDTSGDPAAACYSTIGQLQNPLINSNVSSKNLFIAQ